MTVQKVKKGMILRETDSGRSAIIQALSDREYTSRGNGQPNSFCEFEAINLITGKKITVGAANPPQPYAPGLEYLGMAKDFIPKSND